MNKPETQDAGDVIGNLIAGLPLLLLVLLQAGCSPATPPPVTRATTVDEALATPGTIESLDLFYRRLKGFPPAVLQLPHLRQLVLRTCTIGSLPDEIAALTELASMDLSDTALTNLPPAIGSLPKLQRLWLNDNTLTQLPHEIGQLGQLTYLNLDRNQLTALPPEVGRLRSLRWLRLNGNPLTRFPEDLTGLAQNLETLYLIDTPVPESEIGRIRAALPNCKVIAARDGGKQETKR